MRYFTACALFTAVLILTADARASGTSDAWTGKEVVTKSRENCPRIGTTPAEKCRWFRVYRVELVQREWLWVVSGDARGWVRTDEVLLYEQALVTCTEQIRLQPTSSSYTLRGNVWSKKQQYEIAIADFTEAIRLDPLNEEAYSNRGDAQLAIREYDKALDDFQRALRIDPTDVKAFINSGSAWLGKSDNTRALACLDEAIRLDPSVAKAFLTRAKVWYRTNKDQQAFADVNEAIRLDPKNVEALEDRVHYWGDKDDSRTIADCTAIIQVDPLHAWAYENRAGALERKQRLAEARADYEAALRIGPRAYQTQMALDRLKDRMAASQ